MIELKNISKSFDTKTVLRDVSLKVERGQSLAIIGGSGTGKSVTLKCILGLITPDQGVIEIDGSPLEGNRKPFFEKFGMLFQGGALFDSLPVWRNVAFRLLHEGVPKSDAKELAIAKLKRVGLKAETAGLFPAELSGGMQKRVGLARAIATDPAIIFFAEPTTGLDPIMSGVINELIREIVTEMGATTITITHDMSSVRTISDQVAMLHDGKVQWSGQLAELETADDLYLRQFLSGSAEGPIEAVR